jgi:dolichol-phosphate mannosyltransferase
LKEKISFLIITKNPHPARGRGGGFWRTVYFRASATRPTSVASLLAVSGDNTLVIGSRYLPTSKILNWPLTRRIFSKFANFYANLILRIGIHDYTNGYRVYGREALKKLDMAQIKNQGYIVLSEISYQLFKKGVKFAEVPTRFVNRRRGASNFSLKEIREAFTSVIRIRWNS